MSDIVITKEMLNNREHILKIKYNGKPGTYTIKKDEQGNVLEDGPADFRFQAAGDAIVNAKAGEDAAPALAAQAMSRPFQKN